MTRDQHRVFIWMLSKTNVRREIKCSAHRLALKFNISEAYAGRLLKRMEEREFIEILRRGTGQRPNLYRLERIDPLRIKLPRKKKTRHLELSEANKPRELRIIKNETQVKIRSILPACGDTRTHTGATSIGQPKTRLTVLAKIPKFTIRVRKSPFVPFRKKQHDPTKWNAQDIVCYYGLLFQYEYGTFPPINWKRDVGAARNLLRLFEDHPDQVKVYLQMAFGLSKRDWTIGSLSFFTQEWVISMVIQKRDIQPQLAEDAVDLYRDKEVLRQVV